MSTTAVMARRPLRDNRDMKDSRESTIDGNILRQH
jgi:hypothetical protein